MQEVIFTKVVRNGAGSPQSRAIMGSCLNPLFVVCLTHFCFGSCGELKLMKRNMLWFNFILGVYFISLCFGVCQSCMIMS